MKRTVFLGICLALLLLRVGTLQGQSYTMTDGQTVFTCAGTFYDPGGPDGNYDNGLDYMQTFISASPDMCLKVTFTSFVTEACCDKLYVYDGDTVSGTLIGTYAGTNTPFSVISSTGVLTFLFHSDYSVTKSGWEATISCVECSLPPLVEPYYSMHHGTDTIDCLSPPRPFYDPGGIDGDYSGNSHYVQTFVSSDPNRCLTVTFTDFATEMYLDKLFVYDGDSPSGIILGVYTGYPGGFSVTSVTGALTFVFDSDSSYNETGWVATVSCSDCDDPPEPTNNMHYGTDTIDCSQAPRPFYDPGGPNGDYDDHLDYVQTFVSSEPDSCLQVTFTSIDIADWNGLYVHDGTSTSGTLLGVLTGIDSNVTIVSTTGALTFHFLPYYGFGAGWEAVISCTSCPSPPPPPPPPPSSPCSPGGIHPFCTDENPYGVTYASGTSGESASSFLGSSQYSCLYTTPNPAWYYMQIDDPGDLLIYIQQVSATGTGLDVDFVCWGPFVASSQNDFVHKLCNGDYTLDTYTNGSHRPTNGNHQNNMGGYPGGNVIDCSYSAQSTEWCFIPNTQHGEWYLFLLTNYSGQAGTITYSVVNEYSAATTNCNLLAPITANDPLCDGDTLVLTCMEPLAGAIYHWSGPGGWTATTDVPYVTIAGIHANQSGQYTLHITGVGSNVDSSQVDVTVNAVPQVSLTASDDEICQGGSVTLQADGAADYEWSPTAGTGSSITVTPGSTTTYTVIGTTNGCKDTVIHQVTVFQNSTGDTTLVACDSILWNGVYYYADTLLHDTLVNAQNCDSVVSVHLTVTGLPDISINPSHDAICEGASVTLNATTGQGLSYLWNTGATTSTITDTPEQTAEYSVTVTNSYGCRDSVSLTITVDAISEQTLYDTVCQGEAYDGHGFTLTAAETNAPGTLTLIHTDTVGLGCVSSTTLLLTVHKLSDTTIHQTACDSLVWDGVTYFSSTLLHDTLHNIHGCDSVVTVNLTVTPSPEIQIITNPSPAAICAGESITLTAVPECGVADTLLFEGFDGLPFGNIGQTQTDNGPGSTELTFPSDVLTDAFISGVKVFPAGDAVKLGSSSAVGSLTSNYLDLSQGFVVTIRAKGWNFSSNPKKTIIRVSTNSANAQEFIVNGNSDFADHSFAFSAAGANAQLIIETVNASGFDKRAFIDFVRITREVPCAYQWYTSMETLGNEMDVTVTPSSTSWYYFSATSPAGCGGTDSVEVMVNHPEHQAYTTTQCESYTWNGTTYTESGHYTYSHEDANGCTRVDTLHLTIDNYTSGIDTKSACGSYIWMDGNTYTESNNTATHTIPGGAANGCDSVVTLNLTIYNPVHTAVTETACESYTWNGTTYTQSGLYTYSHEDANGCLQVDTLHLTIDNPTFGIDTKSACDSYTWIDGITYTESNTTATYTIAGGAANGCDSVVTLHLTIIGSESSEIYVTECENYSWYDGETLVDIYTSSGDYTQTFTNAAGCDSVVTLHLTILMPTYGEEAATACESYTWNGTTYYTSGDYDWTGTGVNGCDSTATLHLTITGSEPTEIYATECENYQWFDGDILMDIYMSSGDYTMTFTNAAGCDSVVTLHLTILTPAYTEETVTECVSYTWNGTTYYTSGEYDWTGTGANGCDSTVILHLTIHNPTPQSYIVTAYDSYVWVDGDSNTYVQSGTYQCCHDDANGCQQVDTLHLTVHYTSSNVFSETACDSYDWDGRILTQTGTYDTIYTDQYGADSTVTLHLIIRHSTHQVETVTACDSFEWHGTTYTNEGVYVYEYTNSEGCPSADTLYLTLSTTPDVIVSGPHFFCPDSTVTLTAVTETVPESYLWSNGATTASITVSEAGVYTVTAYYAGGCSAVSDGFHVFETENPIVDGYLHDMIAGDTQTVVIGTQVDDNLQYAIPQSTLTYSTVTFLPDGVPCEPLGCSYKAEMSFSGFPDTAVIHSADEIRYIRLKMEHSAPIDLYIRLICPNEQQADILRKYDDDSESECLSFIDTSHIGWPEGNVNHVYYDHYPYKRPWMGQPNTLSYDLVDLCDTAKNKPGVGWNYCWSDNTTEGYQYASANGCLVDTSNSIYYYSGGFTDLYHLYRIIIDSTNVAAGTQYYHPDESFDSLVGCPVNGTWTVEVIDGDPLDNGYIFECEMGVAEHLSGTHYTYVSEMFFDGLWTGDGGNDSTFVITPPMDLANDTVVAYTFTLIDENGCAFDTVIYINVYAHKHIDLYDTVNASELPLVWEGLTFNRAGCQDTLLHTVHGADSVVTLHLSVIYHYDTAVCANKTPLYWHNQSFSSTSSVTVSQSVESGCADSIEVLLVKVHPVFRDTLPKIICATETPFLWRGGSYSVTGTYYDSLASVVTGCDSIYVLQLVVYPIFRDTLVMAVCDNELPYQWHGGSYSVAGTYYDSLTAVTTGCDSICVLQFTVNPVFRDTLPLAVCENELPLLWRGYSISTAGTYYDSLMTVATGCDSIYVLELTVNPVFRDTLPQAVCENELPYHWRNHSYSAAGTYYDSLTAVITGCDSIYVLELTVNPVFRDTLPQAVCENELPYHWHGGSYSVAGTYYDSLTAVTTGCDSIYVLQLTVNPVFRDTLPQAVCENELPYQWRGDSYSAAGIYYDSLTAVATGCDSIFVLQLTVNPVFRDTLSQAVCENELPYQWHGGSYHAAGTYYDSLTAVATGCDSIFVLELTVNPVFRDTLPQAVCENELPYQWRNHSCSAAGTYYDSLTAVTTGCDSIFVLELTVNPVFRDTLAQAVCENELPYQWHGGSYSVEGIYYDSLTAVTTGCDSIFVLELTVNPVFRDTLSQTVCENGLPYQWHGGSYHAAGTYYDSLTAVTTGCDSIYVLQLAVNPAFITPVTDTICEGDTLLFFNQYLTETGVYTEMLQTVHGCDSIIEMSLTVNEIFHGVTDMVVCESDTPYVWRGNGYSATGTYYDTLSVPPSCDSIFILNLTIHPITFADTFVIACDSFVWRGVTYHETPAVLPTDTLVGGNAGGCDSVTVLHLTIHHSTARSDTVGICEGELPYIYGDTLFEAGTVSGIYVLHDTTVYGCDSMVTLHLQVSPNTYKFRAATICESMLPAVWEGHTWTGEGTIIDTFPASNGCDSIVTKTLTVGVTTDTTVVDSVVENQLPYILNGKEYYTTGIYQDTTMNTAACDSIITLDLTVFFNVTTTLDSTVCDYLLPLSWNGVLFGAADTQSVVLTAATGADSTVVMRLHVNESPQVSVSGPTVFCAGDSADLTAVSTPVIAYHWSTGDTTPSINIHTAGMYTVTVTNEHDCTAADSLNVSVSIIGNPIESYPFPDMCAGEEYLFEMPGQVPVPLSVTVEGLWVTAVGDTSFLFSPPATLGHDTMVAYTFHFQNQYGCHYDTTVYSDVYVPGSTVIDTTVCNSFVWNGVTYTQSDTVTLHFPDIHGCDSVVTLHLVVNHSSVTYDTLYLVENQLPYWFEPSDTLFQVGSPTEFQFSYTIPVQDECDSTVVEKVYIYMNYFHASDTMVCSSALPLTWHGHTFTDAGTFTETLLTVHGSDSILVYTVNVDALNATIDNVTHINCYGESTGAATATVTGGVTPLAYQWTNASGSMVSVTTQISNRPAGSYTFTVTDSYGCTATQSVTLNTLHGEMQPGTITGPPQLCYGETLGTVTGTAAAGDGCVYQWQISGDGTNWSPATGVNNTQDYTSTGLFSESFMLRRAWISGACGTLYSNVLTIAVWPVSSDTIHDAICAGEPYQQHGFDIPATETVGQTELTSVNHLTNIHGCDSLMTLVLTIFESQETVINAEVCEGEGYHLDGFSVSASETVGADTLLRIQNYQTVHGCDSVVRLEVAVIDTALRIESLTDDFCDEMTAELVVVTDMTNYEWSTGEQMPNITVIAPGVYHVTASQGGCSVTAKYVIEPCVIELYLPNAISPSREDGLNDYFGISEYAQRTINLFEISIFNRWGEMVFHSTDKGFRWNGEYKGTIYHENVYNYIIHYTDSAGRPFHVTGSITVL